MDSTDLGGLEIGSGWPPLAAEILPLQKTLPDPSKVPAHRVSIDFMFVWDFIRFCKIPWISGLRGRGFGALWSLLAAEILPLKKLLLDPSWLPFIVFHGIQMF